MLTTISNYTLDDIRKSINYLLDKVKQEPRVRELAINIVSDKPDSISAIYDWVKTNVKYTPDPVETELFISPVKMVNDYHQRSPLAGDCDDMAILSVALFRSVGVESNVVIFDTKGEGYDHAIAQAYSDKLGWLNVDVSSDYPLGWTIKYRSKVVV